LPAALNTGGGLFNLVMIDIFEIETLIAKDKDNKYNTVCVNLDDYQNLKKYIVKGRIKGYYIAGFNLIESGAAILGKSPIHETNE
jgi:hypothetical protein